MMTHRWRRRCPHSCRRLLVTDGAPRFGHLRSDLSCSFCGHVCLLLCEPEQNLLSILHRMASPLPPHPHCIPHRVHQNLADLRPVFPGTLSRHHSAVESGVPTRNQAQTITMLPVEHGPGHHPRSAVPHDITRNEDRRRDRLLQCS